MSIYQDELKRATELYKKGLTSIGNLSDAQRNVLLQSTRQLEALGQQTLLEKNCDELNLLLQKKGGERAIELLSERQEAGIQIAKLKSRIQSVQDKLAYTANIRAQSIQDESKPPRIEIYRKNSRGPIAADADSDLFPGDVVEVTYPRRFLVGQ